MTTVTIQSKTGLKDVSLNRRRAIREKCLNCSGWNLKEVEQCTFKDCALYPYRISGRKQNAKERNKAIRAHCTWCMAEDIYEIKRCTSPHCALFTFRGVTATSQECPSLSQEAHIEGYFEANSPDE